MPVAEAGQLEVGQKLVENGLRPHERARRPGLFPGDADEPDHGGHDEAEKALQREGGAALRGEKPETLVDDMHEGHEDYQQVGELRLPFSDAAQVRQALNEVTP